MTPFMIGIALGILAWLILLRPVILWYFKISRAVKALESIAESLEQLPAAKEHRDRLNQPRKRVA